MKDVLGDGECFEAVFEVPLFFFVVICFLGGWGWRGGRGVVRGVGGCRACTGYGLGCMVRVEGLGLKNEEDWGNLGLRSKNWSITTTSRFDLTSSQYSTYAVAPTFAQHGRGVTVFRPAGNLGSTTSGFLQGGIETERERRNEVKVNISGPVVSCN